MRHGKQSSILQSPGLASARYGPSAPDSRPDGAKLSKRDTVLLVQKPIRAMGLSAGSTCNYLVGLGWAHGDEEVISHRKQMSSGSR